MKFSNFKLNFTIYFLKNSLESISEPASMILLGIPKSLSDVVYSRLWSISAVVLYIL